jgi:GNAT superfamily N-acetyltransferase
MTGSVSNPRVAYGSPRREELRRFIGHKEFWADPESARRRGLVVAARVDRRMVAFFFVRPVIDERAWQLLGAVHPDYRRKGIGRGCATRVLQRCVDLPDLETFAIRAERDSPGDAFARSLGFRPIHREGDDVLLLLTVRELVDIGRSLEETARKSRDPRDATPRSRPGRRHPPRR